MSYRIRGEVTVDAEDLHYQGEISVTTDVEGILELMEENKIQLADVVKEHWDDDYSEINDESVNMWLASCTMSEAMTALITIRNQIVYLHEHLEYKYKKALTPETPSITESDNQSPSIPN